MDKESLTTLQARRIMNMTRIYERIGESSATISTKLSRPNARFARERLSAIETEIVNSIAEVVHIAELDVLTLISRLLSDIEYHSDQKRILDSLITMEVQPICYIIRKEYVEAIYLDEDRYRPRTSEHNSKSRFMSKADIFKITEKITLTDRGKNLINE